MSDFDDLRAELAGNRGAGADAESAVARARDRLARLAAEGAQLTRVLDPADPAHRERQARLEQDEEHAQQALARARAGLHDLRASGRDLADGFGRVSDPREAIGRLDDSIPILMMPVRLETRFRTIPADTGGAPREQLWVRVYPDDCWIDSFDPDLTVSELADARSYWTALWQAGGIEDQERGAWRLLASAHGSGRASWIVQAYQPDNPPDQPTKAAPQDVVLTVAVDAPLPAADVAPVQTFWRALWLADGDAAASTAARAALDAAVGAARADELVASTQPTNFAAPVATGFTKATVDVDVAVLVLAEPATKPSAWARPPRAIILPDRFVFVGYRTDHDPEPVVVLGRPVTGPLAVGPDPAAAADEQLQHDADGNLVVPEELAWLSDFPAAVDVGMGITVDLDPAQARSGFARVLVLGLRLSADEAAAGAELETLLWHHAYRRTGLAVVPLGTPTNNTDDVPSGRLLDDPDASFDDLRTEQFTETATWLDKRDGQWVAEYLGIDPAVFVHTHAAGGRDQQAARAMNAALWPATLGYWMESMMSPVFGPSAMAATRAFFARFVVAGGACPSIRIGEQPYGILPATALSRAQWFELRDGVPDVLPVRQFSGVLSYLEVLHPILRGVDDDMRAMQAQVAHVGKSGDPHALLLDIVGLHPGSVEWTQRYAESLQTLFNRLNLLGLGGFALRLREVLQRIAARNKLSSLGYAGDRDPPILDLSFSGRHNLLSGGVVDDRPLSETEAMRAYTEDGRSYLQWLIDAASASLDALYRQEGFLDDRPPTALLYLLLRHALQLGYGDVSIRLHEEAGIFSPAEAMRRRLDDPILHIRDGVVESESRYFPLYTAQAQITGDDLQPVHEYIGLNLPTLTAASGLRDQLDALARLDGRPTAQLERALADHLDTCSYRLDAWLLGIVNAQLALMRNLRDLPEGEWDDEHEPRTGIHLGGYAWVEPLRPEGKVMAPVDLSGDDDLQAVFGDGPPLMEDTTNQGYVHAPSLNHGVAAAVLRNGFLSNATPDNPGTLAVNLTSARVRAALTFIEGVREGQSLSALLGYQFERGLHDRHALAEVDKFIYKLRKAFPLRADRLASTKTEEDVPIEAIEARNVMDGLAFVEHLKESNALSYPFGKGDMLPDDASPLEQAAINAEADRLRETHDAVADLALAEGVYQAVLGNYDRVASTYDAYARGNFPPEPDVVRTPLNGIGLTHRFALHLAPGLDPLVSPVAGVPMTPRAQAEPAVNHWLAGVLPPPDEVGCTVTFRSAAAGAATSEEVTLDQLDLQPADLLVLVRDDDHAATDELDDRIVRLVRAAFDPRPDVPVTIEYLEAPTAPFTVFELMPLVRHLRRLVTASRPLQPTDLTLANEARTADAVATPVVDKGRFETVGTALQGLRDDVAAFLAQVQGPLSDLDNRRDEILADVDTYGHDLTELLARAALFAVPQAGWGFVDDFRRRTFDAILRQCAALAIRWGDRLAEFAARIANVSGAATDEERFTLLAHAEAALTIEPTAPVPATPAQFENQLLAVLQPTVSAKRQQFADVAGTSRRSVAELLADVRALLPIEPFDVVPFDLAPHENAMVAFAQDAATVATVMLRELDRRLAESQARFDEHDGASVPATRRTALEQAAKALLGEDARLVPEFALTTAQGDELAKAVAASASGELFEYLTNPTDPARDPVDFPVDEWLYGLARVRPKLHAWEQAAMYAGALGRPEPELVAAQLPVIPGDRWLGLAFPPDLALDTDRLLYTSHHTVPFAKAAPQCGLLLDEWTETIPVQSVDTGITFHHDRPNSEAPQVMLLVTPTAFNGGWRWDDLVDALNETLDLAKRRAVEPRHLDASAYAPFLPATVMASQVRQLTIAADLALNNNLAALVED